MVHATGEHKPGNNKTARLVIRPIDTLPADPQPNRRDPDKNTSNLPAYVRRAAARNLLCVVSYEAGVNEVTKAAAVTFRCGAS
ncbi:MAG: hypothetical protein U0231_13805 [Nitrospiraceae bacterium]